MGGVGTPFSPSGGSSACCGGESAGGVLGPVEGSGSMIDSGAEGGGVVERHDEQHE